MSFALPLPSGLPTDFPLLSDEPVFDPDCHLQLEEPAEVIMLADLGYGEADIAGKATPIAASSPFRVLSNEGAAIMLATARALRQHAKPAGDRIENTVRGGCYRSQWLHDLCTSVDVAAHMSRIYQTDVSSHPMAHQLGHLNYEPTDISRAVDKWHTDTLPLDFVLMVTDPALVPGGRFEYFTGTKAEAAELRANGQTPSRDRVVVPDVPGPGYAIALHGNMVVHRGAPLTAKAERITMVNGYIANDPTLEPQSRQSDLIGVDDPDFLYTEWARYAAVRSAGRLQHLVATLRLGTSNEAAADLLEAAVADVAEAIAGMRANIGTIEHFE